MASIIKRKSKYSVIYSYDDENGEKRQKWETWGTLADAKKRKAEIEYKQSTHTFVRPSIKTISDLMYDFVELYGVTKWALSTFDAKKAATKSCLFLYTHVEKLHGCIFIHFASTNICLCALRINV